MPRVTDLYNLSSSPVQVRLLQAIDHPCVIRLEDVIETGNGMLYIILELAEARRENITARLLISTICRYFCRF